MSEAPARSRDAIDKLFQSPELSIERLPVLTDSFAQLASDCTEGFRAFCQHSATFVVETVELGNAPDVLEENSDGVAYVFHANGWDTKITIGLERPIVFSLVESVFGSDGSEQPEELDRPFSKLELRLGQKVAELAAGSLNRFFDGISAIDLVLESVEPAISSGMLGHSDPLVASAKFDIQLMNRAGCMFILIPQSSIYPLKSKLERRGGGASTSVDEDWTNRLKSSIESTSVSLHAIVQAGGSTLGEVAALKVGSVIELPLDAQNSVVGTCNGSNVFKARLVQSQGHYAVTINEFTDRQAQQT